MNSKRVGQAQLAAEAGVHITTVSLALRDSPRLPKSTRERIQAIARKMGYQPDPMLSALTAYRRNSSIQSNQGTLAWIVNDVSSHCRYRDGVADRCRELGYLLETFAFSEVSLARLSKILIARNIHGLLLAPQSRSGAHLNLDWARFSAIAFGHTLVRPQLHLVTNAQYHSARICTRGLLVRGYQRIGFVTTRSTDERTDQNFSAGFEVEQRKFKAHDKMPLLILADDNAEQQKTDFQAWYQRYKPEAIVTHYLRIKEFMISLGISFEQCALATTDCPPDEKMVAGVDQNYHVIGRIAVDLVVSMIHRNERGVPEHPTNTLVEGTWRDGVSAPRKAAISSDQEHAGFPRRLRPS